MRLARFVIPALTSFVCAFAWASNEIDSIQLQTFPTHSRLVFKVDESVDVDWKPMTGGFEAVFKGLNMADFGAPFGEEAKWAEGLKSVHDGRLTGVAISEVAGGVKIVGHWKFASGPDAPAERHMQTFDYREKGPAEFVVDFWPKKGPTIAEEEAIRRQRESLEKARSIRAENLRIENRKIAQAKEVAELDHIDKFCEQPLSEGNDVFFQFLPVHEPFDFSKWISVTTPDRDFPYYQPTADTREAGYVRLALDLYHQGKNALVVRTLDFLDSEYPESPFRFEMRFLRANALIRLNLNAEADRILDRLKSEAKGSPVALYSAMYLAAKLAAKQTPLAAYEAFSWLIQNYPDHRLAWIFHMGAAESLYVIKQTDRAAKEYQWLIEKAPKAEQKADAAFRLGDLFLDRMDYPQALSAYSNGIRVFKEESLKHPALYVNRAETLYQLGQFDDAEHALDAYVKLFPSYPEGWRATFRLAEIHARRPGEKEALEARKWFYETINRYPLSPGVTLARLRLLPCGDHGGFTPDIAAKFFEQDAKNFDGSPVMSMVHYPDLLGLAKVRARITMGLEDEKRGADFRWDSAVDLAQKEMNRTKNPELKKTFAYYFEALFRRNILALISKGRGYDALAFYQEHLKTPGRQRIVVEPDYLLKLSNAASDLGLGKVGEQFAAAYKKAVDEKIALAKLEGRTLAAESKPGARTDANDLDAKLAKAEQSFAEAKARWIAEGISSAEAIRAKLADVVTESPYSFEKEIILGLMDEKQGKHRSALGHAIEAQLLLPEQKSEIGRRQVVEISAWLAGLEAKVGDYRAALEMNRGLEKQIDDLPDEAKGETAAERLGVPEPMDLDQVLITEASLLEKQGLWGESAAAYARAVDQGLGDGEAKYGYARALLRSGTKANRKKALEVLAKLVSEDEDKAQNGPFWRKLASETLAVEQGIKK